MSMLAPGKMAFDAPIPSRIRSKMEPDNSLTPSMIPNLAKTGEIDIREANSSTAYTMQ